MFTPLEVANATVLYNGYPLHKSTICHLNDFKGSSGPFSEINNYNLPNIDGVGNNSSFSRAIHIPVTGRLTAATAADLLIEKDLLKKYLKKQGQELKVDFEGTQRKAPAYVLGMGTLFKDEVYTINSIAFSFVLQIQRGFWESITSIVSNYVLNTGTPSLSETITNDGSIKTDPKLTVTFTAVTTFTDLTFTIGNKSIFIDTPIAINDEIIIDCKNKTVTKNWVKTDFDGTFPELDTDDNTVDLAITGDFTANIELEYINNYA